MILNLFTAILMATKEPLADIAVSSHDESIVCTLHVGRPLTFTVHLDGRPLVLESPIRMEFKDAPTLGVEPAVTEVSRSRISRDWETVWAKSKRVRDDCNELRASVCAVSGLQFDALVRACDDGVAFRVFLPGSRRWSASPCGVRPSD